VGRRVFGVKTRAKPFSLSNFFSLVTTSFLVSALRCWVTGTLFPDPKSQSEAFLFICFPTHDPPYSRISTIMVSWSIFCFPVRTSSNRDTLFFFLSGLAFLSSSEGLSSGSRVHKQSPFLFLPRCANGLQWLFKAFAPFPWIAVSGLFFFMAKFFAELFAISPTQYKSILFLCFNPSQGIRP